MDHISNLIASLRNAEMAGHATTQVVYTQLNAAVLEQLKKSGFIQSFSVPAEQTVGSTISVELIPGAQHTFKRISKPGRRMYVQADSIPTIRQGHGVAIISTSKGLMTGKEARKNGIGGEILCTVY